VVEFHQKVANEVYIENIAEKYKILQISEWKIAISMNSKVSDTRGGAIKQGVGRIPNVDKWVGC